MKDDYYIIYEGEEEEQQAPLTEFREAKPKENTGKAADATVAPDSDRIMEARLRRRRAIEARERRRLKKLAAREERQKAMEDKRKAREKEYARRRAEYEREKELQRQRKEERRAARNSGRN